MNDCPSRQQLDQLCSGQLDEAERQARVAHLKACTECQKIYSEMMGGDTVSIDLQAMSMFKSPGTDEIPPALADHPRYQVLELISVGGMGAVYKARHRFLDRLVVLKVIRQDFLHNDQHIRRFEREAKLAAQLSHPNIVTVYEAEKVDSTQFLVMEFLEGKDFGRLISERGPLPVTEACGWMQQAAWGLEYIHERGMVHRDIKPSNLFLTNDGWVKILDLGLAYLRTRTTIGAASELTMQGQVFGTIGFCSPEQLEQTGTVDIRSDIYSLGCTFYNLLTGQPPFASSSSLIEHIWAHCHAPVPPIRQIRADVPEELERVLCRMLEKEPGRRYSTPAEVAAALEPFAPASRFPSGSGSRPISPASEEINVSKPAKRITRHALASLAALALLAVAISIWFFGFSTKSGHVVAGEPPIKVGILHSRTGTMSISERSVVDATLFAIEEINAAGGVLGRRVEANIEDGQSDPAMFAQKAEKLLTQDKVVTIFGCWTSASRKAVKPVVEKHNLLLVYPVQNEGLEQSPNIIYLGASPNQQIIPAVTWCTTFLKKKRLFLVGSDYIFPRAANAIIRDQVKTLGAEIVGEEYLLLGSTQTAAVVEKIRNSKADVILNTINGDTNIAFFRGLRAAGITSSAIPTISFSVSESEMSSLSPQDIVGDYAAANYFQSIDSPANQAFVKRFQERFGTNRGISDPMEAAYVGVKLWAQAVQAAGSDDTNAIRRAIGGQSFDAPEGKVRIDPETGRTVKLIRIGRMTEDGRFEVIYCADVPTDPVPYPETRTRAAWDAFVTDLQLRWGGRWSNPGR